MGSRDDSDGFWAGMGIICEWEVEKRVVDRVFKIASLFVRTKYISHLLCRGRGTFDHLSFPSLPLTGFPLDCLEHLGTSLCSYSHVNATHSSGLKKLNDRIKSF